MRTRRITAFELVVGRPLPFSVYDAHGVLLLSAGSRIETELQRQQLLDRGARCGEENERPVPMRRTPRETGGRPAAAASKPAAQTQPFPALRPPVQSVQLSYTLNGKPVSRPVQYIGLVPRQSLIVSSPADGDVAGPGEADDVSVRMFTGKYIYMFATTVRAACARPFAYLHLHVPAEVSVIGFRERHRMDTNLPVTIQRSTGESVRGRVVNLSGNGAKLSSAQAIAGVGHKVRLAFTLAIEGAPVNLSLRGIVRNTGAEASGTTYAGIEFEDLYLADKLALQAFLSEALGA